MKEKERQGERKREECYNIDTGLSDKYIMNLPGLWQFNFDQQSIQGDRCLPVFEGERDECPCGDAFVQDFLYLTITLNIKICSFSAIHNIQLFKYSLFCEVWSLSKAQGGFQRHPIRIGSSGDFKHPLTREKKLTSPVRSKSEE